MKEKASIKLSLKGLANYMTASATRQRKILRDFKFPDPEGSAQAIYYREGRDRVAAYHSNGHATGWLGEQAAALASLAAASTGTTATRLKHNARALREYEVGWGGKSYEVLKDLVLELKYGDVRVTVVPDLHVREGDRVKIIKLEFGTNAPDSKVISVISQGMYEAANAAGLGISPRDVMYLDVSRGRAHRGARAGSRMAREIEAACANIAAIWPTLN